MKKVMVLAALLLAGCETAQSISDEVLPRYQGKSVDNVIMRWGQPTRRLPGEGGTVYLWENVPPDRDCRVETHVDAGAHVLGIRFTGKEGACQNWLRLLR